MNLLKNKTIIAAIITGILGLIAVGLNIYFQKPTTQQNHSGPGDNVARDKNLNVNIQPVSQDRYLNSEQKSCILKQISKYNTQDVSIELVGSVKQISNQTGAGIFVEPPDNETINYVKQIVNFLKENNYKIDGPYNVVSSYDSNEPLFEGLLIKQDNGEESVKIIVGRNDGKSFLCN